MDSKNSNPDPIAAIILAAGGSKRLGRPKQLLDWFGKSFIEVIIQKAQDAGVSPIIVVTGANQQAIMEKIRNLNIVIAHNERWSEGQSSSLKTGVDALQRDGMKPFVLLLCDQPQVSVEHIQNVIAAGRTHPNRVVISRTELHSGPPALFPPESVKSIRELDGDRGARGFLNKENAIEVECIDEEMDIDVDTESDYQNLIDKYSKQNKCV